MKTRLETSTQRESELLLMIIERNSAIEQLVQENDRLKQQLAKAGETPA